MLTIHITSRPTQLMPGQDVCNFQDGYRIALAPLDQIALLHDQRLRLLGFHTISIWGTLVVNAYLCISLSICSSAQQQP